MPREHQGPKQRTPAHTGRSTTQHSAAVHFFEECREQLCRIAEDAQNFKTELFQAPDESAPEEWRKVPRRKSELIQRAEDSIKAYALGLRETFRQKSRMAAQVNQDWPRLQIHISALLTAIRDILERAAGGVSDDYDSPVLEQAIQWQMAKCDLLITRAMTGRFKDFDWWIAANENPRHPQNPRSSKLPRKESDLSKYAARIDAVNLTEIQREVFSLRFERGLKVRKIARHLRKDPTTIREHLDAALRKFEAEFAPKPRS